MRYASLHNHTEYSNLRFLDCTNKLQKLIDKAVELNFSAIAITDHESLSGWVKAIQLQKKIKEKGLNLKIILGDEIYLVDSIEEVRDNYIPKTTKFFHFILLAKDELGAKQLQKISSKAWENSFYTGTMERTPTIKSELEEIIGNEKGHLIATTACIGGELSYHILNNNYNQCKSFINWCKSIFQDDFYLEMQPNDDYEQIKVNQAITTLSEELNIPYIITTDSHYLSKEQSSVHEAFLKSRDSDEREVGDFYKTCYPMTSEEIHSWLDNQIGEQNVNKALLNTNIIADKIKFFDLAHNQVVPKVPLPEFEMEHSFRDVYDKFEYIKKFAYSEDIHDKYFLYLIENGWWEKEFKEGMSKEEILKMMERINLELEAIWESSENIHDKISNYYITALDIENMMWDDSENGGNSLVGPARGSVAAFYTCYLIGLQQINPLRYNIPYWRHLHASRPEMPDVDIDSETNARPRIIEATRKKFGYDKVLNICTFKTEGPKSAIGTVSRGLNINNDQAQYIKNLIPTIRGKVTSLTEMIYGNEENGTLPNTEFISECNKFPGLLETALDLEGIVSGRSIHASGVIIFEEPYVNFNCMMRSPNKQPTTQWDMEDSTYCGGLKYDYLTISNLDAMHKCLDLLVEYDVIKWQGSLRKTYEKYFSPDVINYTDKSMWDRAGNLEFVNLFQFMTQIGKQAIVKIKPQSLIELFVANAVMRLMSPDGGEQPLDKYVRYKNNISEWYKTMDSYNLTEEEKQIIEKYLKDVYGMATMQEEVMLLVMDENISNFDMKNANYTRKSIAKKKKSLQEEVKNKFYSSGVKLNTSKNLLDYVWKECITPQLGYSFSLPHIVGYSTIAVQEMNMANFYPIIYWNTANLIVDSASDESNEGGSTNYGKIGIAIANMQKQGINIEFPLINSAKFSFVPDVQNNKIIFALKGMNGIGDECAKSIVSYAPYNSIEHFCNLMVGKDSELNLIKKSQMIQLIKGGCFTELHSPNRQDTMDWYLNKYVFTPCNSLTLSQLPKIVEMNIIPEKVSLAYKMVNFKKYVLDDKFLVEKHIEEGKKMIKRGYHDGYYILDHNSQPFFKEHFSEDSIVKLKGEFYVLSEKKFTKEVDSYIQPLKDWMSDENTLQLYNEILFNQLKEQYASGSIAKWNMEALTYYKPNQHELEHVNEELYGIVNYFDLPEEPEPYDYYTRYINGSAKQIPKFKIVCIAGTVIMADNNHHTVTLLTKYGPVQCKINKGHYAFYNKRISQIGEDGKKHVVEESWFKRGTLLRTCGIKREDMFYPMNYTDTIYSHTINLITEVHEDGTLSLQFERTKVGVYEEE